MTGGRAMHRYGSAPGGASDVRRERIGRRIESPRAGRGER